MTVFDVVVESSVVEVEVTAPTVDVELAESVVAVVTVPGAPGPPGPPGDGGVSYQQSAPAATWTITHGLGRKPSSVTVWIGDELVDTTIETPDTATVVITFATPQSGRAEII